MAKLALRYPRLWNARSGPVGGRGLATTRKVILGLPSTLKLLGR